MKDFFKLDGKFNDFMTTLANVFILNLCFLIGCIPIITVGTSVTAAFNVALKIYESRDAHVIKQFFKAYVENLKHGIALTFIFGVLVFGVIFDFIFAFPSEEGGKVLDFGMFELSIAPHDDTFAVFFFVIGMIVAAVTLLHMIYVFPLEARYENTLWNAFTNARRIGIKYYGRTILIAVLLVMEVFLFYGINEILFVIGLCIGPMVMIMTIAGIVLPAFKEIESDEATDGCA